MLDLFCLVLFDFLPLQDDYIQTMTMMMNQPLLSRLTISQREVKTLRWMVGVHTSDQIDSSVILHPGRFIADYHIIIIAFLHMCCVVSLDLGGQCHVPRQYLDLWKKRQREGTIIHMMNANRNS